MSTRKFNVEAKICAERSKKFEQREWWYPQGKAHYYNPIICENKNPKEFSLFKEQIKSYANIIWDGGDLMQSQTGRGTYYI